MNISAYMSCMKHLSICLLLCSGITAAAQTASHAELLSALRGGGQVIVMRHAASPRAEPGRGSANPDNTAVERQLDATGRHTAAAMGNALRELKIPVGAVLSSPAYRALETVKLAGLPTPVTHEELGDGGHSMQPVGGDRGNWLQQQVLKFPNSSNTVIVTHAPNLTAAFAEQAAGLADGEALVFATNGKSGAKLLARIRIEEWPQLGR